MKKFLRRLLFLTLILIVLAVGLSVLITSLFGNRIGQRIVTEVNKQITSELTVEGFNISLLSGFPNITVNMQDVVLMDNTQKPLADFKKLSFRLGLLPLLQSELAVKSVLLQDGVINVHINKSNEANFDIFEPNEPPKESNSESQQKIDINKAQLKNIDILYVDQFNQQDTKFWIDNAYLSGQFEEHNITVNSEAQLVTRYIKFDGQRYLPGKEINYQLNMNISQEDHVSKYTLKSTTLDLEGNTFDVNGFIEQKEKESYADIEVTNPKGDLAALIKLIPKEMTGNLENLKSTGDLSIAASIKGLITKNQLPAIQATLQLDRGKMMTPQMDQALKDVSLKASFDNGRRQNNQTTVFNLENFTGYFGKNRIEAALKVENLDNPQIDFEMDGVLPLNGIYGFLPSEMVKSGSGEIVAKQIEIHGRYNDLITPSRIGRVKANGKLIFNQATIAFPQENLSLQQGEFELQDNYLSVKELLFEGAGSEMVFEGTAFNVLPVLFADSLNSKRAELEFNATLQAKTIDFDRLLALAMVDEENINAPEQTIDSIKEATIKKRERVTNFLKGSFKASVDEFNYNKIQGSGFAGRIEFINNEMDIQGDTKAMKGTFNLDGQMFFEDEPRLEAKLICTDIDMNQFFEQTENFGQEVLTADNISGALDAKIAINAYWDESGNFIYDKLKVLAGLGIQEGTLKDFEMLKQFSTFVNIKDLMHIRFTNVQNFLEYRRNKLYIPAMFIQSNAMNLTVSGEHSYENEMKYNLKVNASQILANRFTRHDPNLRPLKARKKGFLNLYYTIFGTIDDYQVKSAKRQVKSDFDLSNQRKRDIQLALQEQFGSINFVDEPEEWRDIPEYTDEKVGGDDEFLDWEIKADSTRRKNN